MEFVLFLLLQNNDLIVTIIFYYNFKQQKELIISITEKQSLTSLFRITK